MIRAILVAAALGMGCASPDYDHLQIGGDVEYHDGFVRIWHGQATLVVARPATLATQGFQPFDVVELRSHDEDIFAVLPGVELDEHVFVAVGLGRTHIDVVLHGELVETIKAIVQEPAAEGG